MKWKSHCTVEHEYELVTFAFNANGGDLNGFSETIVAKKGQEVDVDAGRFTALIPLPSKRAMNFWDGLMTQKRLTRGRQSIRLILATD